LGFTIAQSVSNLGLPTLSIFLDRITLWTLAMKAANLQLGRLKLEALSFTLETNDILKQLLDFWDAEDKSCMIAQHELCVLNFH